MKKLIFLFCLMIPLQAAAQVELVRPADFRYHVTVNGDTLSSRSLDYKAIQDAILFRLQYPDAAITVHPLGMEIRGSFPIAGAPDTVTVTDTIRVAETVRQYDNAYNMADITWHPDVQNFNFEVRQAVDDSVGAYRIAVDGQTGASAVGVATNCYGWDGLSRTQLINERTSGSATADSTGFARWESDPLRCQGIMTYWITERDAGNFSVWFADITQILALD